MIWAHEQRVPALLKEVDTMTLQNKLGCSIIQEPPLNITPSRLYLENIGLTQW